MSENATYLLAGAFIAWNFPQPSWARKAQDLAIGKLAMLWGRIW